MPLMAEQLRAAMALRSKDLPPEGFAREAEAIKSKIVGLANRSAKDPALQNVQNIFREHAESVMETLAMRCADPAGKLAKALDIYAATGNKSDVREFLFPKSRTGRLDRAERQAQR